MTYQIYKTNRLKNLTNGNIFERQEKVENVLTINWQDDITKTFLAFDFESTTELECGQWIELYESRDKETVFYGIIINVIQTNVNQFKYIGYDYGYYLEKNNISIQFEESQTLSDAIISVCRRADLLVGRIPNIRTNAKGIYRNQNLSSILFDVYKKVSNKDFYKKYYFNCKNGMVNIHPCVKQSQFSGYINEVYEVNSFDFILKYIKNTSIENLKNKVEIRQSIQDKDKLGDIINEDKYKVNNSIDKYGLLIHTEEISKNDEQNVDKIAYAKLKELNKSSTSISFEVRADYKLCTGKTTKIENRRLDLNDTYRVISSKHIIEATNEKVIVAVVLHENNLEDQDHILLA